MPRPLRRLMPNLWVVVTTLLLLGGCIQPIRPLDAPPALVPSVAPGGGNRLLVLGEDGNLFTVAPDGTERFELTDDASNTHFYAQPTWSPTAERIAWAEIDSASGSISGALLTAAADGSDRTRAELLFPPFYLYWRPDGAQVAYLSNWLSDNGPTIGLHLVDLATGGAEAQTLGTGQPFYFSWAPDSSQLLTHISSERVGLLALDGTETVLAQPSAGFAAPQWSSDGRQLLYGIGQAERPQLVLADPAGQVQQVVTFFQRGDRTAFSLSPTGEQVAYTETEADLGVNSFGPLFVFNLANEEFEQLSTEQVLAFFWSPAGEQLLFLSADFTGDRPWLRLSVWNGQETLDFGRFLPSGIFTNQYLPFADQYAQNINFWSPDGSAFVYAGTRENGEEGVWVQPLTATEPIFVSEGLLATWSPR